MKKHGLQKTKTRTGKKSKKQIRVPQIVSIFVIVVVLGLTVSFVQQQQTIKQEAASLSAPVVTGVPIFTCLGACPTLPPDENVPVPSLKEQQVVDRDLPPGLQKRGDKPLPPGQAKKIANNENRQVDQGGGNNLFQLLARLLQQLFPGMGGVNPQPANPAVNQQIPPVAQAPELAPGQANEQTFEVIELPDGNTRSRPITPERPEPSGPSSGCTRTIGFWKNHAGFGPQADVLSQHLPIWLGTPNGPKSVHVTTAAQAVTILQKSGNASNGINGLNAQLLASKLNLKSGTDNGGLDIAPIDEFLATHAPSDWASLGAAEQQQVRTWATTSDNYNNGLLGPAHCE